MRVLRYMSKISATGAPGESPKESPEVIAPPPADGDGAGGSSDQEPELLFDSSNWEESEESIEDSDSSDCEESEEPIEDSDNHERVFPPRTR